MGSADANDARLLNMVHAIAGFDQLVHEPHPHAGEPEGNAYHYVIQKINHTAYPYIMYGPYRTETTVTHWFSADNLDAYSDDDKESGS